MNFIANESAAKLRGGYYTPVDLAAFIASWVFETQPGDVLEPSCGDGAFISAIDSLSLRSKANLTMHELFPEAAAKAQARAKSAKKLSTTVHVGDFLGWSIDRLRNDEQLFDGVVGNPPFIRYQYLPAEFQERAEAIFNLLHLKFTKHTNAWVPFILAAMAMLRPGGRLGMIVPAEIIHVMHAQSLRSYLGSVCSRLLIIDPEEIWFEGTLQGAVILFAEKKSHTRSLCGGVGIVPVRGREFLSESPAAMFKRVHTLNGRTTEGKWTRALLTPAELSLLDGISMQKGVHQFDDIAQVDVGIVTGANKFFLVPDAVVHEYNLHRWAHPMFGRSEHCPGVIYDERQHRENAADGTPTNFLWFDKTSDRLPTKAREYIETGERQKLHARYKCRIRTPWYAVPSVYSTDVGLLKRSHDTPRLILNKIGAYTTDTAYRIRSKRGSAERLVYCFLNPLTAVSAELEGRHYGGGVLELVPSEIEKLLIPLPEGVRVDLPELDHDVRRSSAADILLHQASSVLGPLGVSEKDTVTLLGAWDRLRNRRQRIGGDA